MINQNCKLILRDLFSYDIVSAYPTILGKQFYDFEDIDLDNKEERSIYLGKKQRDNTNLSSFLMKSVESLVMFYLQENNVSEDDVITSQRDGFIINKRLTNDDQFIQMKFRDYIDFMIISSDRTKVLYVSDDTVTIKGMPYYHDALNVFYNQFKNLNFYDKKVLFEQMEYIKNLVYTIQDVRPFLIPKNDKTFIVITYKGNIEVTNPDYVNPIRIDREKYFNHYIRDFLRSIYLECY